MKHAIPLLAALCLLAGCAATPKRTAFNTLATTAQLVDTAMNTAGSLYRVGKLDETEKTDILRKYASYQNAANAALVLLDGNYEALTPDEVARLADVVVQAVMAISERSR